MLGLMWFGVGSVTLLHINDRYALSVGGGGVTSYESDETAVVAGDDCDESVIRAIILCLIDVWSLILIVVVTVAVLRLM